MPSDAGAQRKTFESKRFFMQNTEQEFWLVSELITMADRKVAMLCESLIWDAQGKVHDETLRRLVDAITNAPTAIEFHAKLPALAEQIAQERGLRALSVPSEKAYKCGMQGPPLHGYVQ